MATEFLILIILAFIIFSITLYLIFKKQIKLLSQKIDQSNNDMKLINELGLEICSVLELTRVLPKIVDVFAQAGQVNKASLMLLNEETGVLEIKAGIGLSARAYEHVSPKLGEGIAGVVAATGKSILINDTSGDKMLYKDFITDNTKPRPKETLLSLPIIFKGKTLGVINLDSKITGKPFIRNDEVLLSVLANQSAVAITNAQLYSLAITDGLTKLYIHRYFQIRLAQEIDRTKRYKLPMSLIMFDIDKFKSFNDTYGHQTGDYVLANLAKIVNVTIRNTDIPARYGGEEFAIILPETDSDEAKYVAERLRTNIETTVFEFDKKNVKVTVSLGIATYKSDNEITKKELIKNADTALYHAKQTGRNKFCSFEEVQNELIKNNKV